MTHQPNTVRERIEEILEPTTLDRWDGSTIEPLIYQLETLINEERDTSKITRVEVIDEKGRSSVNWNEKNKVELSFQDENRTLKIFITNKQKEQLKG